MVSVHRFNMEVNQLKTMIESSITHTCLDEHIQKPFIDMDKVFLLHFLFKHSRISTYDRGQYIVTVMLIEIALNIHDSITIDTHEQTDDTTLQLSVLAGDYFSSKYYYILSSIEDIAMTQKLASSIRRTSENRMKLYFNNYTSLESFFDITKAIESDMFKLVAKKTNMLDLMPYIEHVLLINKLKKEKEFIHRGDFSYMEHYLTSIQTPSPALYAIKLIDKEINRCKKIIEQSLYELPYYYSDFKTFLIDTLNLQYKTTMVEEG